MKTNNLSVVSELNLDRMVRSATAGWAGEPYCQFIVENVWGTPGWRVMSVRCIESFWEDAAKSDLTVREFIAAKRVELS